MSKNGFSVQQNIEAASKALEKGLEILDVYRSLHDTGAFHNDVLLEIIDDYVGTAYHGWLSKAQDAMQNRKEQSK